MLTPRRQVVAGVRPAADPRNTPENPVPGIRRIRADAIQVDHGYQRAISPASVNAIAKSFDPQLFGIVVVSERTDGSLWVLDGQHRIVALVKMGHGDTPIPCEVLTGLSWAKEAEIYDKRNRNRKAQTPAEKFKGALAWGDPVAVEVAHIVRESGYTLNLADNTLHDGNIAAVAELIYIHTHYRSGTLAETLSLIRDTWGGEAGPRNSVIRGVALFLSLYRDRMSTRRFVAAVGMVTMDQVLRGAKAYRQATGSKSEYSVCTQLIHYYNAKLHSAKRLPSIEEMRALQATARKGT